jgi:non-ribosomal peptide synthetase component F
LQVTSFAFDLSVYDVFGTLAAGAAIRLTGDAALREPGRIARLLADEPVTFWNSAPAVLAWVLPFVPVAAGQPGRDRLRRVFLSGDWVPLTMPAEIRERFPRAERIVVLGGATEATVWSNYFVVGAVDPDWVSVPYGRPMQNARYYVLDDRLRETPVGKPGNLYIAGDCLALRYHADPQLTARRFLPDTVAGGPGERMYDTGDLARWWPEGILEFLGRVDHQVKVRGYRVELGEVEAAVAEHGSVRAAVVVAPECADGRVLAAFYVAREPVDPEELRTRIADRLPDYMVPVRLWPLTELPLTVNGKVDRAALTGLALRRLGRGEQQP